MFALELGTALSLCGIENETVYILMPGWEFDSLLALCKS